MRLLQCFINGGIDGLDVFTGSQLGVNATKLSVQIHLAGDDAARDHTTVRDDRRGGFITGAFDP
jgi:hypothetical protein